MTVKTITTLTFKTSLQIYSLLRQQYSERQNKKADRLFLLIICSANKVMDCIVLEGDKVALSYVINLRILTVVV